MEASSLPMFPYHRDPITSGSVLESDEACECCGKIRGVLYQGVVYSLHGVELLCPWCIADGSAAEKYDASFFDAYFCDENLESTKLPSVWHRKVFAQSIGFATFNPIGWWVHCGEPAEYVKRNEPYDMIFECRKCGQRQVIHDLD